MPRKLPKARFSNHPLEEPINGPGGAAEVLYVNAGTLRNRMNKLGIEYCRRRKRK